MISVKQKSDRLVGRKWVNRKTSKTGKDMRKKAIAAEHNDRLLWTTRAGISNEKT